MLILSPTQQEWVETLIQQALGSSTLPSVLLHGSPGVGKRTLARAVARDLHLDFIEVDLGGSSTDVETRLIGNEGSPAGAAFTDADPALVYLSGVENLSGSQFQRVAMAVANHAYYDRARRRT